MSSTPMPIDWKSHKELLVEISKAVISRFFEEQGKNDLCAIGYVFELPNQNPQFDLCADTHAHRARCLAKGSLDESDRWNSGCYEHPARITRRAEFEKPWDEVVARLHKMAGDRALYQAVYDGLVKISCQALAEIAASGLVGDWTKMDFNVSEVCDEVEIVAARDQEIRRLIRAKGEIAP